MNAKLCLIDDLYIYICLFNFKFNRNKKKAIVISKYISGIA